MVDIVFTEDKYGEFLTDITRPSDGACILGRLTPPGIELNNTQLWEYGIAWDVGSDPEESVDAHVYGTSPDRITAEIAARKGMIAALEQGAGDVEVKFAIAAL